MSREMSASKPDTTASDDASAVTKNRFFTATHFCSSFMPVRTFCGIPAALCEPLHPPESPPTR